MDIKSGFVIFCILFTLGFFAYQGFMLTKPNLPAEWFVKPEKTVVVEVTPTPETPTTTEILGLDPMRFGKVETPKQIYQPLQALDFDGTLSETPQKLTCHEGKGKAEFDAGGWSQIYVVAEIPSAILVNMPNNNQGTVYVRCDPTSGGVMYIYARH